MLKSAARTIRNWSAASSGLGDVARAGDSSADRGAPFGEPPARLSGALSQRRLRLFQVFRCNSMPATMPTANTARMNKSSPLVTVSTDILKAPPVLWLGNAKASFVRQDFAVQGCVIPSSLATKGNQMGGLKHVQGLLLMATCGLLIVASPSLASAEPCKAPGDTTAATIALDDPDTGSKVLVQLAIWIQVVESKGGRADLLKSDTRCDRRTFKASGRTYTLRGDDDAGAFVRVADSGKTRAPLVYVTPVPDFATALASKKSGPAPNLGFALVTFDKDVHTVWRAYTAIPGDDALQQDMEAALTGGFRPLMRVKGRQVQIIVPASQ